MVYLGLADSEAWLMPCGITLSIELFKMIGVYKLERLNTGKRVFFELAIQSQFCYILFLQIKETNTAIYKQCQVKCAVRHRSVRSQENIKMISPDRHSPLIEGKKVLWIRCF
jgi:hypothetical protein